MPLRRNIPGLAKRFQCIDENTREIIPDVYEQSRRHVKEETKRQQPSKSRNLFAEKLSRRRRQQNQRRSRSDSAGK